MGSFWIQAEGISQVADGAAQALVGRGEALNTLVTDKATFRISRLLWRGCFEGGAEI